MKIHSKAVHAGDRKRGGPFVPVTTPIHTAVTYFYDTARRLDRIFGHEETGWSYSRYGNPTCAALEELIAELEGGPGAQVCSSGMAAVELALQTALVDRPKRVLAAHSLYGATVQLIVDVMAPWGIEWEFVDICNLDAVEAAIKRLRPGCILMETISNPLLRVGPLDRIAELARQARAALVVDNTFATPLLVRPLELGANLVVHSLSKYLAGHGDVLGGVVVSDEEHLSSMRTLAAIRGPNLGPFEAYLAMRGIKTFPLRVERQCANACQVAQWLAQHPAIERVHYPGLPDHPDRENIERLLPAGLWGGIVSFEIRGATKEHVIRLLDSLKMIVPATSLGDVHSMILHPSMSSHRDLSARQRELMGIRDNLVRLSVGIEDWEDIVADLEQALAAAINAN